jgi:competence protein ComEA
MFKRNWLLVVIATCIIIFIIILNQDLFDDQNNELTPIDAFVDNEQNTAETSIETTIIVDIKGEVAQPGIYEVEIQSRINDVINLAGGFSAEADQTSVNLAQKVQDEMMIIVPKLGEITPNGAVDTGSSTEKVRINYATQDEVETLSGIGPSKAEAIIQYRDENGLFTNVEDLLQISGIGEKTLENIRDDIQIP